MLRFLKVLARNLAQGPATDPFPAREAYTPDRFRGRVTMNPEKCVGCGICRHVCAGRAIRIQPTEDGTGYNFTIWHNTCCLCGMCRHFCPTRAITMTTDWHNAHPQDQKYDWAEHRFVPYLRCSGCYAPMRILPPDLAARVYAHSPVDMNQILTLCPDCRRNAAAARLMAEEKALQSAEDAVEQAEPAKVADRATPPSAGDAKVAATEGTTPEAQPAAAEAAPAEATGPTAQPAPTASAEAAPALAGAAEAAEAPTAVPAKAPKASAKDVKKKESNHEQ